MKSRIDLLDLAQKPDAITPSAYDINLEAV